MEATPPLSPDVVELVIKNPARTSGEDFRLRVSLDNTIQQVKQLLQDEYEGNPEPSYQTLIYCGKVMMDPAVRLRIVLQAQVDESSVHTMHLVVKQPQSMGGPQKPRSSLPVPSPGAASRVPQSPATAPAPVGATLAEPQPPETIRNQEQPDAASGSAESVEHRQQTSSSSHDQAFQTDGEGQQQSGSNHAASSSHQTSSSGVQGAPAMATAPPLDQQQAAPYYIMDPVMAAAYNAALTALMGVSTEAAGLEAQRVGMNAMPFHVAPPPLATFVAQMLPHGSDGQQANNANAIPTPQYGTVPFPYGAAYPYHMGAYAPYLYPFAYPQQGQGLAPGHPVPNGPSPQQMNGQQQPGAQPPQQAAGAAAPRDAAADQVDQAAGERQQIRVRLIRLNIKMLLQLGVFALILYQHCSPSRFFMLLFGGLFLYGTALVPMRRMLHNIVMGNRHVQGGGVLREIQMLFLGFVASLLPGWNFNPEDAAAFQAGQEMAAGEGAARGNERDHQD